MNAELVSFTQVNLEGGRLQKKFDVAKSVWMYLVNQKVKGSSPGLFLAKYWFLYLYS